MWKSKFYGAFALNRRVDLHAIDATPARWRGDAGSSPLDRARTAASSPRNDLVKNCRVHPLRGARPLLRPRARLGPAWSTRTAATSENARFRPGQRRDAAGGDVGRQHHRPLLAGIGGDAERLAVVLRRRRDRSAMALSGTPGAPHGPGVRGRRAARRRRGATHADATTRARPAAAAPDERLPHGGGAQPRRGASAPREATADDRSGASPRHSRGRRRKRRRPMRGARAGAACEPTPRAKFRQSRTNQRQCGDACRPPAAAGPTAARSPELWLVRGSLRRAPKVPYPM